MVQLRITPRNLAEVGIYLGGLAQRAQDMRVLLARFGIQAIRSIERTFEAGGRPRRWVPWSVFTAANEAGQLYNKSGALTSSRKRSAGARTGKVLVDSGRLKNSVTARVVGRDTLAIGTNVIYGRIHQLGGRVKIPPITMPHGRAMRWYLPGGQPVFRRATSAHTVTIPARPWLVLQEEDLQILRRWVTDHVKGGGA